MLIQLTRVQILSLLSCTVDLEIAHVVESKTVLDSGFHAVDSRFKVLDLSSVLVGLGFWIR